MGLDKENKIQIWVNSIGIGSKKPEIVIYHHYLEIISKNKVK